MKRMLKNIIETIFSTSTMTAVGALMVLTGACCDPDKSSVPVMVALMAIGAAMVMYGILGGECDGYELEEYESEDPEFDEYEFMDPGDTVDIEGITDEGRWGA